MLDIVQGSSEYAIHMLLLQSGIVFADRLDGHPDIVAIIEASDRRALVAMLIPVINKINGIAKDLKLLVSQDNETSFDHSTSGVRNNKLSIA